MLAMGLYMKLEEYKTTITRLRAVGKETNTGKTKTLKSTLRDIKPKNGHRGNDE